MKMLTYHLEERGEKNLYEYIYTCIKNDILDGKIIYGEKLPSKRALARNLGVSVITIENAYAQLLLEGYIISKEKRGYYVNHDQLNSRKKKDNTIVILFAIFIVIVAILGGYFTASAIMKKADREYDMFADLQRRHPEII